MIRTQIYLTALERQQLLALTDETGLSQSELIKKALISLLISIWGKKK